MRNCHTVKVDDHGWQSEWLRSLRQEFSSTATDFVEALSDAPARFSDFVTAGLEIDSQAREVIILVHLYQLAMLR